MKTVKYTIALSCALLTFASASAFCEEKSETRPERSSNFSLGVGTKGVGTDFGSEFSITSPFFSNDRFAFRFSWDFMEFSNGLGSVIGSLGTARYNTYNLNLIWSSWITNRLRGFWNIGVGVIPGVDGVMDYTSLAGDGGFGLEYFPALNSHFTFAATLGASGAYTLSSGPSRAPYGNGVTAALEIKYYPR